MENVVRFLERHCQWFAIGLGVLFLGYMVWEYTPISPTPALAVQIKGEPVLPGHIEETIDVKSAALEKEMDQKNTGFKIPAPPVLDAWLGYISLAKVDLTPLASPFNDPGARDKFNPLNNQGAQNNQKVTQLPVAPLAVPATPTSVVQQRTIALVPPNSGQAAAGAAGAGAAGNGAGPAGGGGGPGLGGGGVGGGGGQAPPPVETDVDVVSVLFTISHADLAAAFNKAFGTLNSPPATINTTMVLSVDLIREELQPDGKTWGNQTVIAPLPIHNIMELPKQQNPDPVVANNFVTYVEGHTADVLQPSYYDTRKDMPVIFSPDQPPPVVQQPDTPAPVTPQPPPVRPYTPPGTTPRNNPNTPRRPRAGGYGALLGPGDAARVITVQYPGTRPPNMEPGLPGGNPWMPQPGQGPVANASINGKFDITKLTADIRILGHDDTVVPGRTYHYMVRYTLLNSIWGFGNIAKPASLAQQFYMISPVSNPTPSITIPTRLRFFLASIFRGGVVFDVFNWQHGRWNKTQSPRILPGDAITGTDWSVLDVREDLHSNSDRYVLLLNNLDGTTERHSQKQDKDNPDYQQLQDAAAKPAQADAGGRAPGM